MASNQGINLGLFEASFLSAHNKYRKLHGSPPLLLNRSLCSSAQKWADHLLSIKVLQHSNSGVGENLYYKSSFNPQDLPGNEGVDSWYREVQNYNYSKPGFSAATGHFTQVVWKDSKEVGYGLATDGKRILEDVPLVKPTSTIYKALLPSVHFGLQHLFSKCQGKIPDLDSEDWEDARDQVVWKDSKEVGYGLATDGKRIYYLVAQYSPAGNITNPGYFQRNVLPAGTAGSR